MSVIEKILKLMEEKQITARKLTTELELANSSISEWKKGKAKPSLEAVVKIAKYFGVTTDSLLLEEVEKPGKLGESRKPGGPLGSTNPEMEGADWGDVESSWQDTALPLTNHSGSVPFVPDYPDPNLTERPDLKAMVPVPDSSPTVGTDASGTLTNPAEEASYLRNYRSHIPAGFRFTVEVSKEEVSLLECYKGLDEKDKEYIRCKMVVMKRESAD